jgi:hypothetical protein
MCPKGGGDFFFEMWGRGIYIRVIYSYYGMKMKIPPPLPTPPPPPPPRETGQGSSPFETKWRGAGCFKSKGIIVILYLHCSSPFETKWRGSLYPQTSLPPPKKKKNPSNGYKNFPFLFLTCPHKRRYVDSN